MSVFNVVNALRSTEKDSCPSLRSWIRWQTSSAWQRNRKLGFPFCFTVMPIVHCFLGHTRCWSETQLPRTDVWLWVTVSDLVLKTMQLFSCVLQQGLYKSFALASEYTISLGYKSFEHFDTDKNPSERMPQMAWLYCCVVCTESHNYLKLKPAAKGNIWIVKEKYWQTEFEIVNFTERESESEKEGGSTVYFCISCIPVQLEHM